MNREELEASLNWDEHAWKHCDIPDAWLPIIEELDKALPNRVSYAQIKTKFGGLRVYINDPEGDSEPFELARQAEVRAESTCMICGGPAFFWVNDLAPTGPRCSGDIQAGRTLSRTSLT